MDWSFHIEEQSLKHSLLRSWGLKHLLMPRSPALTLGMRGIKWCTFFWWLNSLKKTHHLLLGLWWSKVRFICTRPAFNSSQNEWRGKIEFYTPAAMINVQAVMCRFWAQGGTVALRSPSCSWFMHRVAKGKESLHKWIKGCKNKPVTAINSLCAHLGKILWYEAVPDKGINLLDE